MLNISYSFQSCDHNFSEKSRKKMKLSRERWRVQSSGRCALLPRTGHAKNTEKMYGSSLPKTSISRAMWFRYAGTIHTASNDVMSANMAAINLYI